MSATETAFAPFFQHYMQETHDCLSRISAGEMAEAVDCLWQAYLAGSRVWVAGNGGSASTAIHFACCLTQGTMVDGKPPFRAEALVGNIANLTAIANDHGYEHVFAYQLRNCLSAGDVVIAVSCSGNSPNVVAAVEYANAMGAETISFLGFSGGRLKEISRHTVYLDNHNYGQVETVHLSLAHLISQYLKERIAGL